VKRRCPAGSKFFSKILFMQVPARKVVFRGTWPRRFAFPFLSATVKEEIMRKLALGIGAAALLTAAAAAPAMAQVGFYAGPYGVGVGVGAPAYYDCGYYGYPCGYYDYYGGPDIVVGGGWGGWHNGWHHGWHGHFHR
jgi:hypothetical protein